MLCCWGQTRSFLPLSGYALVTTSNFAHNSDGDPALPLYFSTDMVSTYSTSTSEVQIKSRSIGLPRAMCFQQGHGHLGPWRTCGRRRSILSMALLSSTLQAGTNKDQINYYVWSQGEACYYGRSTEFTLELRFQPQDHPGDLTQILEAHLLYLLNNHWWLFSPKNFTLRLPSGGGAPQLDRCNRPTLFQVGEDPSSIKIPLMMLIFLLLLLIFISFLMV